MRAHRSLRGFCDLVAAEIMWPFPCLYRETRKPSVANARNNKAPVVSAPGIATSRGTIGAKARQTAQEMNIQTVNPASRNPDMGFGSRLIGE
jgi:hypothetical protein